METKTRVAIIGGTGFGAALVAGTPETRETEYGSALLTRASLDETTELLFLARHGAGHTLPPHQINHRANIAALRDLGVDAVFATTAVGSLRPEISPGDFVVLDDFLDFTKGGVTTFFSEPGQVRHTDFSHPYDPALRGLLLQTAGAEAAPRVHAKGTYLCVSGPRYETPAEVRLFGTWAHVVGMTGAPEAILCREAGLRYASVSLATNYGTGLMTSTPLSHAEVERETASRRDTLAAWLLRAARAVSKAALFLLAVLMLGTGLGGAPARAAGTAQPLSAWRIIPAPKKGSPQLSAAYSSEHEWGVSLSQGQPVARLLSRDRRKANVPFRTPTGYQFAGEQYVARVADGWLVGFNKGEFGGSLWWFSPNGRRRYKISNAQVCGFVLTAGGLLALTGLAHMGYSNGWIIRLTQAAGGRWQTAKFAALGDAPYAGALDADGSVLVITSSKLERVLPTGEVQTLLKDRLWLGLSPNSLVRAKPGVFYAGMRSYVVRFQVTPSGVQSDWLLPRQGR